MVARSEAAKQVDKNVIEGMGKIHKAKKADKQLDIEGEDKSANVAVFSKEQLKKSVENVKNALAAEASAKEKYDLAKGSTKTAYNTATKMGVPQDELKFIIEQNDYSDDFKANVNIMQEMLGHKPTFNFEETKH